ncbi:hypothetical protein CWATWH0005_3181 [Crocosphaera watsonii WH 0005]|uniref:Uncharacterized protein n=1 Tax=Crocosphaera watsonii WH 0005 TaxID=423472 RepID=T2IPB6_CROWT|nr:hypothetical protein [Crocosphaera watsonii]CCQ55401.1 hypothetical protein CWATWH0005_3181 [Crocosphaera watsonii WH 0005]
MSQNPEQTQRTADTYTRTIPAFGRTPPFFLLPFLPSDHVQPVMYLGLASVLISIIFNLNFINGMLVCLWLCGTWLALTGFRPWLFVNQFIPLPKNGYYNVPSDFVSAENEEFEKIYKLRQQPWSVRHPNGGMKTYQPLHKDIPFHALMEIDIDGYKAAIPLLKNHREWSANIPFCYDGIHHELYDDDVVGTLDSVTELLDNLLAGERITFYQGKYSDYQARADVLNHEANVSKEKNLAINNILMEAEAQRSKQLTHKGLRQLWQQLIFCSWRQSKGQNRGLNFLTNIIDNCELIWQNFSQLLLGTKKQKLIFTYASLGQSIFNEGLMPWLMLLKNTGKLNVRFLSVDELWQWLWERHQTGPAPAIPQYIKVFQNQQGQVMAEIVENSPRETLSVLFANNGVPFVTARNELKIKDQLVAAMCLDGGIKQEGKPDSFGTLREQLRYILKIMARRDVRDTEFWVECELSDTAIISDNLQKTAQQSSASNKQAAEKGKVLDVFATELQKEALEAQKLLYQGHVGLKVGFTALLYRKDRSELERATQTLAHAFGRALLIREQQVAWIRYLETSPLTNKRQLTSCNESGLVFDPRLPFPSTEVPGLLPLSQPRSVFGHPKGVEFLCESKPLYLHPLIQNLNFMITATKGGGKSVMSFAFVRHCMNYGPILAMDMATGADSTFALIAQLYGEQAAYIDMAVTPYNPIMMPDLRNVDQEQQQKRLAIWKSQIQFFLLSLVMGHLEDALLEDRCRSLLQKATLHFWSNSRIQKRYQAAIAGGLSSTAWQKQPTLSDFLPFCTKESLKLFHADEFDERALVHIQRKLSSKINDPNIGRVISSPSGVNPKAVFTVFSLAGLQDRENAHIMALVASQACSQIGMSYPRSLFLIDECSTILRVSPSFADLIGARFAIGRKFGQSTGLIGQDLESVFECRAAGQIMANLDFSLIGKTTTTGAQSFEGKMNIPRRLIRACASRQYEPWREQMLSYWLLKWEATGDFWKVAYGTNLLELALLSSNPHEKELKAQYLSKSPTYSQIATFVRAYKQQLPNN